MPLEQYEAASRLIKEHGDEADFEAQPSDLIDRAEAVLGVQFPEAYRRFLADFGAGGVGGEEIYGIVNADFEDPRPPQAVGLTLAMRRDGHVTDSMIVIYNLGQGSYYALDTAQLADTGRAPVVGFTPGLSDPAGELEEIAPDFGTFFLEVIQNDLEDA